MAHSNDIEQSYFMLTKIVFGYVADRSYSSLVDSSR